MPVHHAAFGGKIAKSHVRLQVYHRVIHLASLEIVNIFLNRKLGEVYILVVLNVHINKVSSVKIGIPHNEPPYHIFIKIISLAAAFVKSAIGNLGQKISKLGLFLPVFSISSDFFCTEAATFRNAW